MTTQEIKQAASIKPPQELKREELKLNKTYIVDTTVGEIEQFKYLGGNKIHVISQNINSFLLPSDIVYEDFM